MELIKAEFGNLKTDGGIAKLNDHMCRYSYVCGYTATQDDVMCMCKMGAVPDCSKYPHANRWFRHICHMSEEKRNILPEGKMLAEKAAKPASADDDFDLFGEDTEEDKEAKEKLAKMKKDAAAGKKKAAVISKSSIVLDVKPTVECKDLDKLAELIRSSVYMDGLVWGSTHKKLPLVFGLYKLQMSCAIEDEKVNVEDLTNEVLCVGMTEENKKLYTEKRALEEEGGEEEEEEDEDEDENKYGCLVQSVDIASFNKI